MCEEAIVAFDNRITSAASMYICMYVCIYIYMYIYFFVPLPVLAKARNALNFDMHFAVPGNATVGVTASEEESTTRTQV